MALFWGKGVNYLWTAAAGIAASLSGMALLGHCSRRAMRLNLGQLREREQYVGYLSAVKEKEEPEPRVS